MLAGTNGKGTCGSLLTSALERLGLRTALYSSPHLRSFNERAMIDNAMATDDEWREALQEVEKARQETGDIGLTYFEYCTLAALWLFAQRDLDVWVLEVGLGGRLDAVNIMDADCAIITSVSLDHIQILGRTREDILYEKIAIARAGRPLVYADPSPPTNLHQLVAENEAELLQVNQDFGSRHRQLNGMEFLQGEESFYARGDQQLMVNQNDSSSQLVINIATAWQALCLLRVKNKNQRAETFAMNAVQRATIAHSWWNHNLAGRWQRESLRSAELIFDVAHNPPAAQLLAQRLKNVPQPIEMVFGMMQDKDWRGFVRPLLSLIRFWHLVPLNSERGLSLNDLSLGLKELGARTHSYPNEAALLARIQREEKRKTFIVCGSFLSGGGYAECTGCP